MKKNVLWPATITFRNKCLCLVIWFSLAVLMVCQAADETANRKPLWEIALFNGAIRMPQYPASDEYHHYVVPIPYLIYRGDFFRSSRGGVTGMLFQSAQVEWFISVSGNPPVANDNTAREGMEKLNALFGVGPSLRWYLTPTRFPDTLYFQTSVQAITAIDFSSWRFSAEGYSVDARLRYKNRSWLLSAQTRLGISLGIDFADNRLHGCFYDVNERDVRSDRPFYQSSGGYSGFQLSTDTMTEIHPRISVGTYFRWNLYKHAVFEDSPLARRQNNFTIGGAIMISLFQSAKTVTMQNKDE